MTIQDAIKSGKPFRRQGWDEVEVFYLIYRPGMDDEAFPTEDGDGICSPTCEDILAEDWYTK